MTDYGLGITPVYPFSIANGSVVMASDPANVLKSMIVFCVSTQVRERVMRPTWGIDIMNSYLALGAEVEEAVREAVEEGFHKWFPGYVVKEVGITKDVFQPTWVNIDIKYGREESAVMDDLARVAVLLPSGEEIAFDEGTV